MSIVRSSHQLSISTALLPFNPAVCVAVLVLLFAMTAYDPAFANESSEITTSAEFKAASVDDELVKEIGVNLSDPDLGWTPGEVYDPMTGQMRHHMVDMLVKGNGQLPIVVSRSFGFGSRKVNDVFNSFAGYTAGTLDVPTISYRYNRSGALTDCRNLYLTANSNNPPLIQLLHSFIKFQIGPDQRYFFSTNRDDQPSDVSQFPGSAYYVSSDNWIIRCVDSDQNGHFEFHVHSPDGITYVMNKMYAEDPIERLSYAEVRVTSIRDPYGNSLTYHYEGGNQPQVYAQRALPHKLLRIQASDGREVRFFYDNFHQLIKVVSNGSPRPQIVDYAYRGLQPLHNSRAALFEVRKNNLLTTQYYSTFPGLLRRVTYPTGGWVDYNYSVQQSYVFNQFDIGASYVLAQRNQSDGGVYRFETLPRDGNLFSRIVRTPVSTIDYKYQKSSYRYNHWDPTTTQVNDGRLLSKTIHSGTGVPPDRTHKIIQPLNSLIFAAQYSYERLKWQSHFQTMDTQFVVQKSVSRQLDGSRSFNTVFSKFDAYGRPRITTETNPAGLNRVTTREYLNRSSAGWWINGKIAKQTVSGGNYQINSYNAYGDRTVENNNGIETKVTYHHSGPSASHIRSITDAEGNSTVFEDYYRGIPRRQWDKTQRLKTRTVNSDGTVSTESRLGDSAVWRYEYDALGRQSYVSSPRAESTGTRTDWLTPVRSISYDDHEENWSETVLDGFGRVIFKGKRDNLNRWRSIVYRYDAMGNRNFESYATDASATDFWNNPKVVGIKTQHDAIGRPILISRELGSADSYQRLFYGANKQGFLVTNEIDSRSNFTISTYNSYGAPSYQFETQFVDKNNVTTTIERDLMGRVNSISRNGVVRTYTRNDKKQVVAEYQPEAGSTSYSYFADGELQQSYTNGRSVNYNYDAENRVSKITYNDRQGGWVSRDINYNNYGNIASLRNTSHDGSQNNLISYTYDAEDNVTNESFDIDSRSFNIAYEYDQRSSLAATRYPSGRRYEYAPNVFGEPTKIVSDDGKVIYDEVVYHPTGTVNRMNRGSHRIFTGLDVGRRPQNLSLINQRGQKISNFYYDYDTESNVSGITDFSNVSSQFFEYDKGNRLIKARNSAAQDWAFGYDANDNLDWVQHGDRYSDYQYATDTQRLLQITSNNAPARRFGYDDRGNMTSIDMPVRGQTGAIVNRALTVNAVNQITWTDTQPSATSYGYDGRGLRIRTTQDGTVYTIYDSNLKLRYRHDVDADVTSEYFYVANQLVGRRDSQYSSGGGGDGGGRDDGTNDSGRPDAPTGLSATATGGTVTLTWNAVSGAEKYNIFRDDAYLRTVNLRTDLTDDQVSPGTHSYFVIAEDSDLPEQLKLSSHSATVTVNVAGGGNDGGDGGSGGSGRPAAPTGLNATVAGTSVVLNWNAVAGADKYNIFRDNSYLTTVNQSTNHTDDPVGAGSHSYFVIAEDADLPENLKLSEHSETVTVTVGNSNGGSSGNDRPAAPTGLAATVSGSSITLTWNPVAGAEKYNVFRNDGYIGTANDRTDFNDDRAGAGTHTYFVIAEDADLPENLKLSEKSTPVNASL